jgi:hypothetical protein
MGRGLCVSVRVRARVEVSMEGKAAPGGGSREANIAKSKLREEEPVRKSSASEAPAINGSPRL